MKESDSKLQAKVWSTLGQAASDQRTQLLAHVKALEILEKDTQPAERAQYLVEFAEWCLAVRLPRSDAENALLSALDALLDMDDAHEFAPAASAAMEGEGPDDTGSRADSRTGSRMSVGTGAGSRAGTARSSGRPQTSASAHSRAGSTAGSDVAAGLAGVDPNGFNVAAMDITIRVLCMLAKLAPSSQQRRARSLEASYYAERCIHLTLKTLNQASAAAAYPSLKDMADDALKALPGCSSLGEEKPVAEGAPEKKGEPLSPKEQLLSELSVDVWCDAVVADLQASSAEAVGKLEPGRGAPRRQTTLHPLNHSTLLSYYRPTIPSLT